MRFVIYESREGLLRRRVWRWRLVAGNNEIIAQGEGYTRREDAERGVRLVMGSAKAEIVHE